MTRNVFRYYKRLIGPVVTTTLVILAPASMAWGQPDEVLKLLASDAGASDQFGNDVAIDGDTAIVGARYREGPWGPLNTGGAYIFQRDYGGIDTWGEVVLLLAQDGQGGDLFGESVSISGDIAIVGASFEDENGIDSGSAYIFYRDQGGPDAWDQVAKLTASDGFKFDHFGGSVSISGDIAIVAALLDDDNGTSSGSAYIFYRDQGGPDEWNQVAKLTASDAAAHDWFGSSVSISGDTAIVGARHDDDDYTNSGSAYIFQRDFGGADNWGEIAKLNASDPMEEADFGRSVSISVDRAAVGAPSSVTPTGSAYVFYRDFGGTDNWGEVATLTGSDGAPGDQFGSWVSIRGDIVIVGAPFHDDNGSASGSAYVFDKDEPSEDDGWGEIAEITASDAAASDLFGVSVSIGGDFAIVGAVGNDDNGSASGSAYVFDGVCPCPWDLDGDDRVGVVDLVDLLANWGPCADCTDCPWDFDANCTVGASDLLALLANWGLCPCAEGTPPPSLADELADACLTQDDWDDFVDKMQNGTEEEKKNYLCWMQHYLYDCDRCTCTHTPLCPGPDPFG